MPDTNMQTATGSIDAMQAIFHQQKAAFEAERHRPLSDRKADLEKIEELVKTRGDEFAAAIDADFGRRSKSETALAGAGLHYRHGQTQPPASDQMGELKACLGANDAGAGQGLCAA